MYDKVNPDFDFVNREKEILEYWKKENIFKKSLEKNKENNDYIFYDGPPTANGKPHIGHILTRVMKDLIPRFKNMKGFNVPRKAGWDTHGLPVELEVEKLLGIDGKQEIEKYGVEDFIRKCKESVWKYKGEWEVMSDRVGYWVDMENPYITYDNNYIESVWWAVKQIHDKGLLYKGFKIVPYCPRCGTALSSHEVAQGYKDVTEKSVFVKFPLKDKVNTYFLAWTTTPWTLPSNLALCVNPVEDYVEIESDSVHYILAKELVSKLFEDYKIVSIKKGKEYEGVKYLPLFDYYKGDDAYFVTCDGYVTLTDGSGIVHIAPAFGEDDANVGKKYNLPFLQMVDERGIFKEEATDFKGLFAKDADKFIIENLAKRGLLFKEQMYTHSYPHCWRCDTPLLYYARSSWFIAMTKVKDKLIKNNSKVNWIPPSIGSGRMGNFLENVIDWGVSRERYWGTPLPVWVCDKCGKIHVIGSKKELCSLTGADDNIELHKPYIDALTFKCDCGGNFKRTSEVMDCWFDSGSMPFAQLHYPFENKELFEKNFPADFICEAVDQTRGWFYTLLAISTLLFDKPAFKNCIVLGHVNDKDGIKMSKHKGNVVDPWTVLDKQGADAVRWYFYSTSSPWLPSRFSEETVSEVQRKFIGTLWNTYAFYVLYAEIDKFNPYDYDIKKCKLSLMDKWILSEINTLISFVDEALSDYKITEAARKIQDFTDGLSNWYVRRCRERYWASDMNEDKIAAFKTLHYVLVNLAKICAPFIPFVSEAIYLNLVYGINKNEQKSVHLCSFPKTDKSMINAELEKDMEFAIKVCALGRTCRSQANIKNRQPLSKVMIKSNFYPASAETYEIIKGELNVKNCEKIKDDSDFIGYDIKPQLKTLGPKYGKLLGKIREFLSSGKFNKEIVDTVNSGKFYNAVIDGVNVEFAKEDLLIYPKSAEGFSASSEGEITVIIDTELTDKLIEEGRARELVSKIQNMRKDAGFYVTDHIELYINAGDTIKEVIKNNPSVKKDVLCDNIVFCDKPEGFVAEWDIDGKVVIGVKKI